MEVVSEVVTALVPPVAVIYSEEGTLGPDGQGILGRGQNIHDDAHSVFIVVAHDALVGIGGIGAYLAIGSLGVFGGFPVLERVGPGE